MEIYIRNAMKEDKQMLITDGSGERTLNPIKNHKVLFFKRKIELRIKPTKREAIKNAPFVEIIESY